MEVRVKATAPMAVVIYTISKEVKTLEQAVQLVKKLAKNGDIVVMSPASASFDMFKSYKQRGKIFKELVEQL